MSACRACACLSVFVAVRQHVRVCTSVRLFCSLFACLLFGHVQICHADHNESFLDQNFAISLKVISGLVNVFSAPHVLARTCSTGAKLADALGKMSKPVSR